MQLLPGGLEDDGGSGGGGVAENIVAAFEDDGVDIESGHLVEREAGVDIGKLEADDTCLVELDGEGVESSGQPLPFEVDGHHVVGDIADFVAGGVHHVDDALKELLFAGGEGGGVEDLDGEFGGGEEAA